MKGNLGGARNACTPRYPRRRRCRTRNVQLRYALDIQRAVETPDASEIWEVQRSNPEQVARPRQVVANAGALASVDKRRTVKAEQGAIGQFAIGQFAISAIG
jgi:hypothetical protein